MAEKDLIKFLKKIEKLKKISELVANNPLRKKELSDCKNHEEVINLTTKWGFEISKRWGEYQIKNVINMIIKITNDLYMCFLELNL